MQYRDFGNTGVKVSIFGFGAMRLPGVEKKGKYHVKEEESIDMIHRAFEMGVNYIDTAYGYCGGESEIVVGKALEGYRDRVYLSTKMPTGMVEKKGDYRRFLEEQLKKLNVADIDFYHLHGLDEDRLKNTVLKYNLIKEAQKAKDEHLIKHISFSFHDKPEVMKRIIDFGVFESVLCQYNILDTSNEEAMSYAREKGLGVAVMGSVGGGRLAVSDVLAKAIGPDVKTAPELALRFVFANKDVSVALSGMENIRMVEENALAANQSGPLSTKQLKIIEEFISERKKKEEIPCTNCGYCQPCPENVAIPGIFDLMNYYTVYGLKEWACTEYDKIGTAEKDERRKADACQECGECEEKCPQKIDIMQRLKHVDEVMREGK